MLTALCCALLLQAAPTPPLDTMVDVGGYRLHVVVQRGTQPITILLESGGGADVGRWAGVDAQLAARTGATVVAYDRAGFGASELGPLDLAPARQVDDIARVLDALGAPPRRVVVGHSYGALLALDHAYRHARDVFGVVLVDPMNPAFVATTGDFVYGTVPHIAQPANAREQAIKRLVDSFEPALAGAIRAEPLLSVPIVVISAGEPIWPEEHANVAWRASHESLVAGWPQRRLIVAEASDHDVPAERPDLIVEAVAAFVTPPGP